jgi:hypothetical protein
MLPEHPEEYVAV